MRTKKKRFLERIEKIVPWEEWKAIIKPCYYKGERRNKPYCPELMLRLYLLQNLYDLSDEATVVEAIDSRAFSEFCGVESSNQVPDAEIHWEDFAIYWYVVVCRKSCSRRLSGCSSQMVCC